MGNTKYGYIRKLINKQDNEAVLKEMEKLGASSDTIFIDNQWKKTKYNTLLKKLLPGDMLIIDSISSLGENYQEIDKTWRGLLEEQQIEITVLDFPLMNTQGEVQGMKAKSMIDIALQCGVYIRDAERRSAKAKQLMGIANARKKGVKFGRRSLDIPEEFDAIHEQWQKNELSTRKASAMLNVDHKTFKKWSKQRLTEK